MEFDLKYKMIGVRGDIVKDKKSIRQKLTEIMPGYKEKARSAGNFLRELL